ncbi:YbaL family putative K(+) efflux transporter [Uliginosibacterium aquaticum]|uniref:Kef family K(+) transporter n=1 Tax=Uliginosibacterium aquaticum TaxID=2731212 RepID=A0ABX2IG72_9RHOO|nr:YbaL family putative K(+) efflux transporter [Uliginosibacterium aquaticum]NSL55713.1 Kef family K(+) transporter [Uliginosibacterium aquaticum]
MHHDYPLITTLAAGFGLALVLGLLAVRLRLPALLGYLLAGVMIGPFTPGLVADGQIAAQLAEVGVMLLMFGVGLHFSLDDLLAVKRVALPGAILQIAVATALGAGLALWLGWAPGAALIFGLALSVASTVVLLRALEEAGVLDSMNGRIAVGWLVVEDLVMVLVLVLLPPLAGVLAGGAAVSFSELWPVLGKTLLQIGAFIALMLLAGRKLLPRVLWWVAASGSRELFTLGVLVAAISIAYFASQLFGVSFALGAFFAGMVMRESEFSHRAAEESLPLREAFAVLFFVSVGMLFDPMVLIRQPLQVLAVVAIIVFGKSLAAAMLVLAFRYPLNTALTVSAALAQIGEFSFILAGLGMQLGLLPAEGQSLILAGALISIALNPLLFRSVRPLLNWLRERSALARSLEAGADPLAGLPQETRPEFLSGQVVLLGYGGLGRRVAEALAAQGVPYVVVEQQRERVARLREAGIAAVWGDGADPLALVQAHVAKAGMLLVTVPDAVLARQAVSCARELNPGIECAVLADSADAAALLTQERIERVFSAEDEMAQAVSQHVLGRFGHA